jgi:monooxygenase
METFTENEIRVNSGHEMQADIIVTATGLKLKCLRGIQISVDGTLTDMAGRLSYQGMMFRGIPNLSFTLGYSNASWTLKCNLVAKYICRMLNDMSAHKYAFSTPVGCEPAMVEKPALELNSGYILRGSSCFQNRGRSGRGCLIRTTPGTCSTSGGAPSTMARWR